MYGESGASMRQELAGLLRTERVSQRLGGPGRHPSSFRTTDDERASLGLLIRGYRQSVLVWCLEAATAADPYVETSIARAEPNPFKRADRDLSPLPALQTALERATRSSTAVLPNLEQLTTRSDVPLVEAWRQAARAAVMAERDLDGSEVGQLGQGQLTLRQAQTLVADVSAICQALIVLDRRYGRASSRLAVDT